MFPVQCNDFLHIQKIDIQSVSVRGKLGHMTVWVSNDTASRASIIVPLDPCYWTKLYDETHASSQDDLVPLLFNSPIQLLPGQTRLIYIHSSLFSGEGIVCGNSSDACKDSLLSTLSGKAHDTFTGPFGIMPHRVRAISWTNKRYFFGEMDYTAVHWLWSPSTRQLFGSQFQAMVTTLILCHHQEFNKSKNLCKGERLHFTNLLSTLPDDIIMYILSMCSWDWANHEPQKNQLETDILLTQFSSLRLGYEMYDSYAEKDLNSVHIYVGIPSTSNHPDDIRLNNDMLPKFFDKSLMNDQYQQTLNVYSDKFKIN